MPQQENVRPSNEGSIMMENLESLGRTTSTIEGARTFYRQLNIPNAKILIPHVPVQQRIH